MVVISAGANDFTLNYYALPTRRGQFNISEYQDFLQKAFQIYVRDVSQRIVAGLPQIGCLPIQITAAFKNPNKHKCLGDQNTDAQVYNQKLQNLLTQLQGSLPGTRLAYVDVYEPLIDMVNNPQKYGFTVTDRGCCGTGLSESSILYNQITPTCVADSQFVFWDSLHPCEAVYQRTAKHLESKIVSQLSQ
ncbi:hypothetical protein Pint_32448 [Pistacia integerrima]|uniref:Uncharacterized protein n=1 Tax=Pistacia integerrima TaxID=434235 RepID=A0ACC0XU76_9ROSI|nr:hypothetical protein Pint_32448 [Pistacia integerrima]